jgi:hypothetical protein
MDSPTTLVVAIGAILAVSVLVDGLALVDLPVDFVIVLEQQERAHELQRLDEGSQRVGFE